MGENIAGGGSSRGHRGPRSGAEGVGGWARDHLLEATQEATMGGV